MADRPDPTPEGTLIHQARRRLKISVGDAAFAAGLSDTRWRQIVAGYQIPRRGQHMPVVGMPEVLARMAHVVQVTPEQLEQAGRTDAADELRLILGGATATPTPTRHTRPAPSVASVLADPVEREIWAVEAMSPVERADHIAQLRVRRLTEELRAENAALREELERAQRRGPSAGRSRAAG